MIVYALSKFLVYCLWCAVGLRLFAPARLTFVDSIKYGSLRWLIGLGFGVLAAIALGSVSRESVAALYVGVYLPLRVIEWSIMAYLIARPSDSPMSLIGRPSAWLWVLGGIVVSFASDLASPEGMAGRFCVGRCLC